MTKKCNHKWEKNEVNYICEKCGAKYSANYPFDIQDGKGAGEKVVNCCSFCGNVCPNCNLGGGACTCCDCKKCADKDCEQKAKDGKDFCQFHLDNLPI